MDTFIKDTLKKQMQILSERSVRENGEYLAPITAQVSNPTPKGGGL